MAKKKTPKEEVHKMVKEAIWKALNEVAGKTSNAPVGLQANILHSRSINDGIKQIADGFVGFFGAYGD